MPVYRPPKLIQGRFTAAGTDSMAPMMRRWIELFQSAQPGIVITLEMGAPPTAAAGLAAGTAQLGYTGRTLWSPEVASIVTRRGHAPRSIVIAAAAFADRNKTHTLGVFVPVASARRHISIAELREIFSAAVPPAPWHTYVAKLGTGATNSAQQIILREASWGAGVREFPSDEAMITAVANDPDGIGIGGLPFGTPAVQALAIGMASDGPFFEPTLENVTARRYPLVRELYFHVNDTPDHAIDPAIREFLLFVLSREGQAVPGEAGYLPLTPEMVMEARRQIRMRTGLKKN